MLDITEILVYVCIEAGSQIEAGGPSSESLIEAGSRIDAGSGIHILALFSI